MMFVYDNNEVIKLFLFTFFFPNNGAFFFSRSPSCVPNSQCRAS